MCRCLCCCCFMPCEVFNFPCDDRNGVQSLGVCVRHHDTAPNEITNAGACATDNFHANTNWLHIVSRDRVLLSRLKCVLLYGHVFGLRCRNQYADSNANAFALGIVFICRFVIYIWIWRWFYYYCHCHWVMYCIGVCCIELDGVSSNSMLSIGYIGSNTNPSYEKHSILMNWSFTRTMHASDIRVWITSAKCLTWRHCFYFKY